MIPVEEDDDHDPDAEAGLMFSLTSFSAGAAAGGAAVVSMRTPDAPTCGCPSF